MAVDSIPADEAAIRRIIDARVRAVRDKRLDDLMAHLARDILSFDVLGPLQNVGSASIRERAEKWLSSYQSEIGYDVRDLHVTAGPSLGFCHYLYRVQGTLSSGDKVDMWVRATICLRKVEDRWEIIHEHQSVPFDPDTGKASLDLTP